MSLNDHNKKGVEHKVTARFFTFFWIGVIIAITVTIVAYLYVPDITIRDLATVFTTGIICTTLYYHATNLRSNYKLNEEKLSSDRKIAAINLIGEWHKAENIRHTIIARDFLLGNIDSQEHEIIKKLEQDENTDARVAVVSVLNYLERIAIAALYHAADEAVLKDYFCTIFSFYEHNAIVFIHSRRKEKQDNRLFARFIEISQKWNDT
jgi:Domain of unknown function (DUF4760)